MVVIDGLEVIHRQDYIARYGYAPHAPANDKRLRGHPHRIRGADGSIGSGP